MLLAALLPNLPTADAAGTAAGTAADAVAGSNLAAGKAASASSVNGQYVAANITDGNSGTYWESGNGSFPQWTQVDLGASASMNQVVLKLPASWGKRTQTLSLQGSGDGSTFATIVASASYSFDPASNNVVTISFGVTSARFVRVNITANSGWSAAQLSEFEVYGAAASTTNLALGKPMTASGVSQNYAAANAGDGNASTYWESANNAFPQWLRVDLGATISVNQAVLKLPPSSSWGARTQTLAVQGSSDGSSFTDLVPSAAYTFDPATGNVATIPFAAVTTRYLRLMITANTGWPAGQIAEFEVYGPAGGGQPPAAPTNLAYTQNSAGAVTLTWTASTTPNLAAYDVYANNTLLTSVPGSATTYTDNPAATATVTYFVRARDAAGNQSANSNSVTRNGSSATAPTAPGNLAFSQPASGQVKLTWNASSDAVGVTGYSIYRNSAKIASVGGSTLTYTDQVADTQTVSYFVTASNAAGLESPPSNTVTRTGSGGTGTDLALHKPIDGTAYTYVFAPTNADDGDVTTYFEGSSYPSQLTVHLGANADVSSVVVKLNPAAAWSARTQT
ncbi:MAG: Secreted glycosyl hydrolase, partial [Catenulispora sp.]|nr:Secreted glycosyl hydrolase [Catenulispora sp.]